MKNLELFDLENTWLLHNDTYLLLSSDFLFYNNKDNFVFGSNSP